MSKKYLNIILIGIGLAFLWFEVRPVYFRGRCERRTKDYINSIFTPEATMLQKANHINLEEDYYSSCLHHWGMNE